MKASDTQTFTTIKAAREGGPFFVGVRMPLVIPRADRYIRLSALGIEIRPVGSTNPSFMNGVPELLVLRLLRNGEMYGYEIVQAIREETAEVVSLGEGVVYPVLHALEKGGAITAQRRPVNGRSRIYYSVTRAGSRRFADLSETWSNLAAAIQNLLAEGKYGEAIR